MKKTERINKNLRMK